MPMRDSFEQLLVGRTLAERYRVEAKTGAGGMSVVYRATDLRLERPVAVKVISLGARTAEEREELRGRFRREAASAARIPPHPNVVQVYDYGTDPGLDLDFLVMELLEGRDLKEALRTGPMPADEALRVLGEAARGLAAGHRAGIVHRDVKPANLFLMSGGEREQVRILDFGIAKPVEAAPEQDLTRTGQLPHSPAYAAPEQMDRHRPLTPATDVYQLGLIGYEMLAGERPYDETDRAFLHAGEEVALPVRGRWGSVPAPVAGVIRRALRIDPAGRFADAGEFAEALSAAVEETASAAAAAAPSPDRAPLPPAAHPLPALPEPTETVHVAEAPSPPRPPVHPPAANQAPSRAAARLRKPPLAWVAPLVLLALLGVWALGRGKDAGRTEVAGAVPAASPAEAALDETFLRLQGEVARRAAVAVPAAGSGAAALPAAAVPGTDSAPAASPLTDSVAAAQREITAAVHDLNKAWVEGDLSRHVSHYASRVDYYNSRRLPRAGIRRDRTRDLRRYKDVREIGIHSVSVELVEPARARVLVDKEWRFAGPGGTRQGRGTQEYVFKRDADDRKWYVVSEQLLSTTENRARAEG
jgi:serine/threonine protein kinase